MTLKEIRYMSLYIQLLKLHSQVLVNQQAPLQFKVVLKEGFLKFQGFKVSACVQLLQAVF